MAALTFSDALLPLAGIDVSEAPAPRGPGLFSRFVAAVTESRRRTALREIARYETLYGIKLRVDGEPSAKIAARDLPF